MKSRVFHWFNTSAFFISDPPSSSDKFAHCEYLDGDYDIYISTMCATGLMFGVIYSLFGYRCFKAATFLTGFTFAATLVYLVCLEEDLLTDAGNIGAAMVAGFLFGVITMLVYHVGLFVTGFHTGLLVGFVISTVTSIYHLAESSLSSVGILLCCGLSGAVLTLCFQKSLSILGTAIYGGALLALALDYYAEKFHMVTWLWSRLKRAEGEKDPCWFSWLILAVWPGMILVGVFCQACITGKDYYPNSMRYQYGYRKRHHVRARPQPPKHRYVYQVRTRHGDVVSQRYVQAMKKVLPTRIINVDSDSTNTTLLPGPSRPDVIPNLDLFSIRRM